MSWYETFFLHCSRVKSKNIVINKKEKEKRQKITTIMSTHFKTMTKPGTVATYIRANTGSLQRDFITPTITDNTRAYKNNDQQKFSLLFVPHITNAFNPYPTRTLPHTHPPIPSLPFKTYHIHTDILYTEMHKICVPTARRRRREASPFTHEWIKQVTIHRNHHSLT